MENGIDKDLRSVIKSGEAALKIVGQVKLTNNSDGHVETITDKESLKQMLASGCWRLVVTKED